MRHRKRGRKLGRNSTHRLALKRNLAMALIRHERIITTLEKAKEVRPFVEKLITLARQGDLHARRLVTSRLGPPARAEVNPEGETDADHHSVLKKLFDEIGPRFKERPGGYTRIIKRSERRLGDGGRTAFLELLKEGEEKVRARPKAPAPRVEEEPEREEETPASQPEASAEEQKPEESKPAEGQENQPKS
jgi:large subunit ribosomal protein L17